MLEKIILSFLTFAVFVIVHLAVFRLVKIKVYRFRILELLFGIFAVIYTILAFSIPSNLISEGIVEVNALGQIVSYAIGLLIYVFLFFSYWHPYYINERGISVRICAEIAKFPASQLTFEELLKKYDHETLIQTGRLSLRRFCGAQR